MRTIDPEKHTTSALLTMRHFKEGNIVILFQPMTLVGFQGRIIMIGMSGKIMVLKQELKPSLI